MASNGWARVRGATVAIAAILCAGLLAPAQHAAAASYVPISGEGSTWVSPAMQSWIQDVKQTQMTVNYSAAGSSQGRNDFKTGIADFAASEIPYGIQDGATFDPPPARGYTYMPDVAGGLAFAYNLSIGGQRVGNLRLAGSVIAGIFTNQITRWNDPRIAADNPGLALPATLITPVVRSDTAGTTEEFTQWMLATQNPSWTAYCQAIGRVPCTPAAAYPVQAGTGMISVPGDSGGALYVAQSGSNGAIAYTDYSMALATGFPVVKVLNAAGYYTLPTPGNVGVSLLSARLDTNPGDPLYQTADLSQVYSDTDPRAYELSYYSYLILPTDLSSGFSTNKGYTLADFGSYALCHGQQVVSTLGYAPLPVNLVEAGYAQLVRIPGASLPATAAAFIAGCANPTFSPDGTDTLTSTTPMPPACDQVGPAQCDAAGNSGGGGGPVGTTTTLTVPSTVNQNENTVLTATVTAADGSTPVGSVQFEVGGTDIGSPATLILAGPVADVVTFAAAGTQTVRATFIPADPTVYSGSTATAVVNVLPVPAQNAAIPLALIDPPTGTLTLTVPTANVVTLTVSGNTATGMIPLLIVDETRNTYPGWTVTGTAADFAGSGSASGSAIPGNQLGWTPSPVSLTGGAALGQPVPPANPGLGTTAAVLASAPAGNGYGTSIFGADLELDIPPVTTAGTYDGSLDISVVTVQP